MGLTWRDAVGTFFVAAAGAVVVSVAAGWNWPLLADARAGAIALFVLSYPSCVAARAPGRMADAMKHGRWGPFLVVGTVLGALALGLLVAGGVTNRVELLVAAAVVVVALWLTSTAHHLTEANPAIG